MSSPIIKEKHSADKPVNFGGTPSFRVVRSEQLEPVRSQVGRPAGIPRPNGHRFVPLPPSNSSHGTAERGRSVEGGRPPVQCADGKVNPVAARNGSGCRSSRLDIPRGTPLDGRSGARRSPVRERCENGASRNAQSPERRKLDFGSSPRGTPLERRSVAMSRMSPERCRSPGLTERPRFARWSAVKSRVSAGRNDAPDGRPRNFRGVSEEVTRRIRDVSEERIPRGVSEETTRVLKPNHRTSLTKMRRSDAAINKPKPYIPKSRMSDSLVRSHDRKTKGVPTDDNGAKPNPLPPDPYRSTQRSPRTYTPDVHRQRAVISRVRPSSLDTRSRATGLPPVPNSAVRARSRNRVQGRPSRVAIPGASFRDPSPDISKFSKTVTQGRGRCRSPSPPALVRIERPLPKPVLSVDKENQPGNVTRETAECPDESHNTQSGKIQKTVADRMTPEKEKPESVEQRSTSNESEGPQQLKAGWTKNDFIFGVPLGSGAIGKVTKAVEKKSQKTVAIKQIERDMLGKAQSIEQLLREIEVHCRVGKPGKHPYILPAHGYFFDEKKVYLVLEYANGGTLADKLKRLKRQKKIMSESDVSVMIGKIAEGLAYLHENHVIHRDLKPDNVLLTANLTPQIADFGWTVELNSREERRRTVCGTLDYLPKEIVEKQDYDVLVDVWALGCTMYEMLTGECPFYDESKNETFTRIKTIDARYPDSWSPECVDLLKRMLTVPEQRISARGVVEHPWITKFK